MVTIANNNTCISKYLSDKSDNYVNILHLNIASLRKHWDQFISLLQLSTKQYDVIILSDISISEKDNEINFYSLPNYNKLSLLRSAKKGGGLLIFISDHLRYVIHTLSITNAENIFVKIHNDVFCFHLAAVYRPHSIAKQQYLQNFENLKVYIHSSIKIMLL